jgi:multicomponent Na+:H+ antiporter subunit G
MSELISALLLLVGVGFVLISAVGIIRMPDLLIRMHAATKAGTLGAGLVLLATAIYFGELGIVVRAISVIIFLLVTAPVAAHVIGRAAYGVGVPLWEGTRFDELREALNKAEPETERAQAEAGSEGTRRK